MNILIFQYGNYSEAYERFQSGGSATYRDQKESVELVASIARTHQVTVVAISTKSHDIQLTDSLRSIGLLFDDLSGPELTKILHETAPDRIICRTPDWRIFAAVARRKIATLPYFADVFQSNGLRGWYRSRRLRHLLKGAHIPCICNHSRNASLSVHNVLGIAKRRIVPWDRRVIESDMPPKQSPDAGNPFGLFYAGVLNVQKGIDDVLTALGILQDQGVNVTLSLASRTDPADWQTRADSLGVAARVTFLGALPNESIVEAMRAHDAILVPSQHQYPEGLPNTLREALASRTPLVASDHPAFAGRLVPDRDCLFFRGSDPAALAQTIHRLMQTPGLYEKLSANAAAALQRLPYGLYWDDLWQHFLEAPDQNASWVKENSLAALEAREKA